MALRSLAATLIGPTSRRWQMGEYVVTPDDFPAFPDESMVLRAIYDLEESGQAATLENVKIWLSGMGRDDIADALNSDYMCYTSEYADVHSTVSLLRRIYVMRDRLQEMFGKLTEIFQTPYAPHQQYQMALEVYMEYAPAQDKQNGYHDFQLAQMLVDQNNRARERQEQGLAEGPGWPHSKLAAAMPSMRRGDMAFLMGKTGTGKTTFLAWFVAHWLSQGYDVYPMLLETSALQFYAKLIAARTMVPVGALERAGVRHADNPEFFAPLNLAPGQTFFAQEAANWNLGHVKAHVEMKSRESEARGREAVFALDYYTLLDTTQHKHAPGGAYNAIAQGLKALTRSQSLYFMTIVQEQEGLHPHDFTENATPKHGNEIIKASQQGFRIVRRAETSTQNVFKVAQNGVPLKDGLGEQRYKKKAGDKVDRTGYIDIIKHNHDAPGRAWFHWEPEYAHVEEVSAEQGWS